MDTPPAMNGVTIYMLGWCGNRMVLIRGMVMIMVGKRKTYLSCMYMSTEVEKLCGENGKEQLLRQGLERERATW